MASSSPSLVSGRGRALTPTASSTRYLASWATRSASTTSERDIMGRRPKDAPKYEDLIDQIVAEYQAGNSLRDIARPPERKLTPWTVKKWLARAGVKARSTGEGTRLRLKREGGRLLRDVSKDELR